MQLLEFDVLGPLEVRADGATVAVPAGRQREVLLRLLLAAPEPVAAERLVEDLWPTGTSSRGASTVRTYIARLRSEVGGEVIATRAGGYVLDVPEDAVDANRFVAAITRAQQQADHDTEGASRLLTEHLALWRGDPLPEVADRAWAASTVTRLHEQRLAAMELRAECELRLGHHRELLPELADLCRANPLREELWGHWILALYRSGRQADALAAHREVATHLQRELGLEPGRRLQELQRAVLGQDPTLLRDGPSAGPTRVAAAPSTSAPSDAPRSNIRVERAHLLGRDDLVATLAADLAADRLITLTGVGGVGKSGLAVEVAAEAMRSHAGGAWVVELASLSDGASVDGAVAAAVGAPRRDGHRLRDAVVGHLARRDLVLVLDNCEHLLGHVTGLVDELLGHCPDVRILTTSREPLGLPTERVVVVPPLGTPPESASASQARASDAVQLFERRARTVSPGFVVDDDVAEVVARICRRLDGIPLAIELAAARMRVLSPEDLDDRLDQRFRLLTGGRHAVERHQTLRHAIDWSYDLLEPETRDAFRQLAVFAGRFDLAAAAAVTRSLDGTRDVVDLVGRLIDRSLVVAHRTSDGIRYGMLETIRRYALDRLEDAGELVSARHRHTDHVIAIVEEAGRLLQGPHEHRGHDMLVEVMDDLRAAIQWCMVSGRETDGARMLSAIRWERVDRRIAHEMQTWATLLLDECDGFGEADAARVHALAALAAWGDGETDRAAALARDALDRAESVGRDVFVDVAIQSLWILWEAGAHEEAATAFLPLIDEAIDQVLSPDVAAWALAAMVLGLSESGMAAGTEGQDLAAGLAQRAVILADASRCPSARALAHHARGFSLLDVDPAAADVELRLAAAVDGLAWPTWPLHARAHLLRNAAMAGDGDLVSEAAELLRDALAIADEFHLEVIASLVVGALALGGVAPGAVTLASRLALRRLEQTDQPGWRRTVQQAVAAVAIGEDGLEPDLELQVRQLIELLEEQLERDLEPAGVGQPG